MLETSTQGSLPCLPLCSEPPKRNMLLCPPLAGAETMAWRGRAACSGPTAAGWSELGLRAAAGPESRWPAGRSPGLLRAPLLPARVLGMWPSRPPRSPVVTSGPEEGGEATCFFFKRYKRAVGEGWCGGAQNDHATQPPPCGDRPKGTESRTLTDPAHPCSQQPVGGNSPSVHRRVTGKLNVVCSYTGTSFSHEEEGTPDTWVS